MAATSDIVPHRHHVDTLRTVSYPSADIPSARRSHTFSHFAPGREANPGARVTPSGNRNRNRAGTGAGVHHGTHESRDSLIPDSSFHALPYHSTARHGRCNRNTMAAETPDRIDIARLQGLLGVRCCSIPASLAGPCLLRWH